MTRVPLTGLKFLNELPPAMQELQIDKRHEPCSSGEDVSGQCVERTIIGRERIERAATRGAERLAQARPGRLWCAGGRADRVDRLKSATVVRLHLRGRITGDATLGCVVFDELDQLSFGVRVTLDQRADFLARGL